MTNEQYAQAITFAASTATTDTVVYMCPKTLVERITEAFNAKDLERERAEQNAYSRGIMEGQRG